MEKITRWLDKLDYILAYLAAATLFFLMLIVVVDVSARFLFNAPIKGVLEFTGEYLMVIIVYFSVSYAEMKQQHINIDVLQNKFPPLLKKISLTLTNILGVIMFLVIGYNNYLQGLKYINQDIRSVGLLDYPLAPALFIIVTGTVVLSSRLLLNSIKILFEK